MEMEAFTGKLHSYLRSVSTRIEEIHDRISSVDTKLSQQLSELEASQAHATHELDARLSREVKENSAALGESANIFSAVCGKLDQKFTEKVRPLPLTLADLKHTVSQYVINLDTVCLPIAPDGCAQPPPSIFVPQFSRVPQLAPVRVDLRG